MNVEEGQQESTPEGQHDFQVETEHGKIVYVRADWYETRSNGELALLIADEDIATFARGWCLVRRTS